jgi:hypothetical protein
MSAGVKSSSYTIALTGKTFDVLSSMLYKDPILAIIREISVNSADSHTENGNPDQPFEIHLPNTLEPHFSIRDYGVGMSAETIDSVYTKFFESTKTHTNELVGQLGLGSKSPFSYTSNYTITSWHGGLKLVYSAFKSADGIPSIALLDVSDSDEQTGLEVSFAVKAADFEKFTSKVQSFFTTWGSTPPVITGGLEGRKTLRHVTRDFGGTDWFIATADSPLSAALAIQGNVPYPLRKDTIVASNAFSQFCSTSTQQDLIKQLLQLPIIIQFPIGTLDFSASREELQYTEQTTAVILKKLIQIGTEFNSHIQAQCDTKSTQWDLIEYIRALRNDRFRYVLNHIGSNVITWKGAQVHVAKKNAVYPDRTQLAAAHAIYPFVMQANTRRKMEPLRVYISSIVKDPTTGDVSAAQVINPEINIIPGDGKITIVVLDENNTGLNKLRHNFLSNLAHTSNGSHVITVGPVAKLKNSADKDLFRKAVAGMLTAFDVPGSKVKVVLASELPASPRRAARAKAVKVDDTFKVLEPSSSNGKVNSNFATYQWKVISQADIANHQNSGKVTVLYVPIVRGVPVQLTAAGNVRKSFGEDEHFAELWNGLTAVLSPMKVILIGVKVSMIKHKSVQSTLSNTQSLESYLRFWVYTNAKQLTVNNAFHSMWFQHQGHKDVVMRAIGEVPVVKHPTLIAARDVILKFKCDIKLNETIPLQRSFITRVINVLTKYDNEAGVTDSVLQDIKGAISVASIEATKSHHELTQAMKNVKRQFPMLEYVNTHFTRSSYINEFTLVDGCAQVQQYLKLISS